MRGCNVIKNNQVIGRMGKGYQARIAFDLDDRWGALRASRAANAWSRVPTGRLTNQRVVETEASRGETASSPTSCSSTRSPRSQRLSRAWRRRSCSGTPRAVVRRDFKKGEVICREGEFGSTAFFIEKGSVEIYIERSR